MNILSKFVDGMKGLHRTQQQEYTHAGWVGVFNTNRGGEMFITEQHDDEADHVEQKHPHVYVRYYVVATYRQELIDSL